MRSREVRKLGVTWHLGVEYAFRNIGFAAARKFMVAYLIETGFIL